MSRTLAVKVYNNGAVIRVRQVEDTDDPDDSLTLTIQPAKGRGKGGTVALRPDEVITLAHMLLRALDKVTVGVLVKTRG